MNFASVASAQPLLLDRVVARVDGYTITLSDVRAALGLGLITGDDAGALAQLIDRQLVVNEVQRFPPPEPPAGEVDAEAARMDARADVATLMRSTGIDAARVRELARETLRIRAYLDQRFGTTVQVSDEEVDQYYRTHREEFLRDGMVIPFAEAEPIARQRAGAQRRQATIDQWVGELRARATIARPVS